jgi:hypothetical protein
VTPPAAPSGEHGDGTPLVSVVPVTFKRVNVLEDTLRSVLAQTLDDFELIVCDDTSTDGTPVVMAEWPREIHESCMCANLATSQVTAQVIWRLPDLLAVPIPRRSASACRTASFSPRILATDPIQ